ncbi:amidohydrolase [Actinomadura sp. KC345]|uniref:amidohydrolase n=1 Tax=Actinomadura sp. KC345 TaxID=2530371 RepID=UPI001049F864|nr:amidohydrolase [Actinomadura sp. KC345]TDC55029.1 amidohydrolase [Actinomadura sp. KC345]
MPDNERTPDARSGFNPAELGEFLAGCETELIAFRRDLHMHPELGYAEHRTTRKLAQRLRQAGLEPVILPGGAGLFCDIGPVGGHTVALRADIDALPLQDLKYVPYRSTVPGVAHACGHDVHAVMVLGAGLYLARLAEAGLLRGRVRLIFQPAEEIPGGALDVINADGLDGVERIFALHCHPALEVGRLGLVVGPITGSYDGVEIDISGATSHTARPHLGSDVVNATAKIATELRETLWRRIDGRSGFELAWSRMSAESEAINATPIQGRLEGTLRCLGHEVRSQARELLAEVLPLLASTHRVEAHLDITPKLPPAVNEQTSIDVFRNAAEVVLGEDAVVTVPQSLGGDDFSCYLEKVPRGAYARLGVRPPGAEEYDLHQGGFDVDERCIRIGAGVLAATALKALGYVTV